MKSRKPATFRRPTSIVVVAVVLTLAALRCSVDVPLGVDPRSDAAEDLTDGGAGAGD